MGSWAISHFSPSRAEGLMRKGLLYERTEAGEWELPGAEQAPASPAGCIISFTHFRERGGPQAGEVIDLDADEAEGTTAGETGTDVPAAATGMAVATEEEEPAPAATAGTAAAGEIGTPATAAATEEAVATETGTSARGASAEVAPATEAEVPAPEAPTGAGTPVPAVATESDAATGMLAPAPASQAVAPPGRPAAASTGAGGCAPGPSVSPAASTTVESVLTALSSSASASASATPVPRAWRGSVLRWSSRDDPQRPLFTLDDATEWGKWQAMQGGLANARAALSSVLGQLDGIVLPGSQVWYLLRWWLCPPHRFTPNVVLFCRLSKNAVGGNPISFGWSGGSGSASTWTDSGPGSCPCKLPPPSRSSMICRGASRRRRRMRGGWRPSSRSSPRGPAATTRSSRPLPKRPATTPRSSHG
ncbi:uncharacterized protein [Setaria viridis]|uniref:uncharacterized protein n=1 Tax=Setaria viridis TaxID=4556 RepID=UPI003B3B498A